MERIEGRVRAQGFGVLAGMVIDLRALMGSDGEETRSEGSRRGRWFSTRW